MNETSEINFIYLAITITLGVLLVLAEGFFIGGWWETGELSGTQVELIIEYKF